MGNYRGSVDFITRSNRKARGWKYPTLDNVLHAYAEHARAVEKEEGIKPICITCGKEKTIEDVYAICWACIEDMKGGEK